MPVMVNNGLLMLVTGVVSESSCEVEENSKGHSKKGS